MGTYSLKVRNISPYTISDLQVSVEIRGGDILCTLDLLKRHKVTIHVQGADA